MTYECKVCYELNHSSRLHCKTCGTIPACYSLTGEDCNAILIPVKTAKGVDRSSNHKGQRLYLRTVAADYYAS